MAKEVKGVDAFKREERATLHRCVRELATFRASAFLSYSVNQPYWTESELAPSMTVNIMHHAEHHKLTWQVCTIQPVESLPSHHHIFAKDHKTEKTRIGLSLFICFFFLCAINIQCSFASRGRVVPILPTCLMKTPNHVCTLQLLQRYKMCRHPSRFLANCSLAIKKSLACISHGM